MKEKAVSEGKCPVCGSKEVFYGRFDETDSNYTRFDCDYGIRQDGFIVARCLNANGIAFERGYRIDYTLKVVHLNERFFPPSVMALLMNALTGDPATWKSHPEAKERGRGE